MNVKQYLDNIDTCLLKIDKNLLGEKVPFGAINGLQTLKDNIRMLHEVLGFDQLEGEVEAAVERRLENARESRREEG